MLFALRLWVGEMARLSFLLCYLFSILIGAATGVPARAAGTDTDTNAVTTQEEVDEIWSLLAMAIVHTDWQSQQHTDRGHNIAALLIDPAGNPVFWARNTRFATGNSTDHSEVRLIRHFLDCPGHPSYLAAPPPQSYPGRPAPEAR